jgi:site-specific recombinase XerD
MSTIQPKRPGRPLGSVDTVLQDREFGLDQFAAVKSFLFGIDPLMATKRYMLTDDAPLNTESAVRKLGQIMLRIAARGNSRRHAPSEAQNAAYVTAAASIDRVANECLDAVKNMAAQRVALRKVHQAKLQEKAQAAGLELLPKGKMPTPPARFSSMRAFDDWYEDTIRPDDLLDPIELRAQFEEHLSAWYAEQGVYYEPDYSKVHNQLSEQVPMRATQGQDVVPMRFFEEESRKAAARHIEILQWTVQRIPDAADNLNAWIGGTTLTALKQSDIFTLYTLCDLIQKRGASWWKCVPALGPVRAKRIQDWIAEVGVQGIHLSKDMFEPIQRRRLQEVLRNEREYPPLPSLSRFELDPLSPYVERADLNGSNGIFRSRLPSLLKAETDIDAIIVALEKYADKPRTLKVYAREICRFCLWAYQEKGLPLSSIGIHEARQYREFLDNIPGNWISNSPSPAPRNTAEWRAFRGQLDQASQRKALTSINVILGQLLTTGYLTGNPMAGVLKHSELARPSMDVSRSLTIEQWSFACKVLDEDLAEAAIDANPGNVFGGDRRPTLHRLKAMMHLLFATGIRRDELYKARLGHLKRIVVDGQSSHVLEVTGKRTKIRQVLIEPAVMELVLQHVADRSKDFEDDLSTKQGRDKVPMISILRSPISAYQREVEDSQLLANKNKSIDIVISKRAMANQDGALSPDAMLSQLKGFFKRCGRLAADEGIDSETFEKATLHWMRHTFGHTMVDADVDIRVVQKALGHVNINTTGAYSKADMEQMVRGLRQGKANTSSQTNAITSYSQPSMIESVPEKSVV